MSLHKHYLLTYIVFLLSLFCSCDTEDANKASMATAYKDVPDFCRDNVSKQLDALRQLTDDGVADMLFFTDTHYLENSLVSCGILSRLSRDGVLRRVVWGGDAITSYGDLPLEWACHQRDFLNSVVPYCKYYMVRGNHEFTAKNKETGEGITYTQLQTAALLGDYRENDIVRPDEDPGACYYYFDDKEQKLRYCIFDTTDSIASPTEPWSTITHVSQQQLDWMNQNALHDVPEGFQLVVITHVGIIPEMYVPYTPYEKLHELIINAGAPVLMVISGHRHQDFQTFDHGTVHVMTGCDAFSLDVRNSPFLHNLKRLNKHYTAPLMDMITFSSDRKTIYALRVGAGYSRIFHLDPITLRSSDKQQLPSTTVLTAADQVRWTAYDATGYSCLDEAWDPPCTVLRVSNDGFMQPQAKGEAVLMATARDGRKEFFSVIID